MRRKTIGEEPDGQGFHGGQEAPNDGGLPAGWADAPCAICGSRRGGAHLHLTHTVTIWLCPTHRHARYLTRDHGTHFARRLAETWAVTGTLTTRRVNALRTHLRRAAPPTSRRPRPGSYSWPALRREAETRFAAGDPPGTVISELRARHRHDPADVPTVRTMRRWFTDGRWLRPPRDHRPAPPRRPTTRKPRPRILQHIDALPRGIAIAAFFPWYLPPPTSRSP